MISVIITAHNEGEEVRRTIQSVTDSTRQELEIILVDDASTDGSTENLEFAHLKVIRHTARVGIAPSRRDGMDQAQGDCLAFLDAHQRLSDGCLDQCAAVALRYSAIVWPDVKNLTHDRWLGHGAWTELCASDGQFKVRWQTARPRHTVSRITGLVVPGYVMPSEVARRIRWIDGLQGWGASEPAVAVKAFFLGIRILHLCGPLTRHLFRKEFPFEVSDKLTWRNHALIARVCFSERTWERYWLPHVFSKFLTKEALSEMDTATVLREHEAFQSMKLWSDREFWTTLLRAEPPSSLE